MSETPIIRCVICGKFYFDVGEDKCPHCDNKPPNNDFNMLNEMFGFNNPFSIME
jgi:hypothetical protein